jgi:hypothetical protein
MRSPELLRGSPGKVAMQRVEIRTKGQLDEHWAEWFEGLNIAHTAEGDTILSGQIGDQAALHGLLAKLRDLGVSIHSVKAEEIEE